ncbi:MAG: hypothetical protein ABIO85_05565, partial [Sphingomicrobium sp.]
ATSVLTEITAFFSFGTLPAMLSAWAQSRVPTQKGSFQMFVSARQTATALAAAFITSLLFVSSATSALPIV